MNFFVSYNWLKEYVDLKDVTPEDFARRISLSGPGIEKLFPAAEYLDKIVVGHVLEIQKHPNADTLYIATVDIGGMRHFKRSVRADKGLKRKKIDRMTVEIVCGGSNLLKDQWVVIALVGAKIKWHGDGDLVTLESAEIRGVKSDGMICAASEIGLFDAFPHTNHEILDLGNALGWSMGTKNVRLNQCVGDQAARILMVKPGTPLADALGLSDDVIMDIEVTTNRVDAMGMVGIAREASAILKKTFTWKPVEFKKIVKEINGSGAPKIKISAKKECPRFLSAKIEGVEVKPSPWWMKRRLLSAGIRPINNIVDISNYVLLELSQPMHVYDAAKLNGGLDVRLARPKEKIMALDGNSYDLDDTILVIADRLRPVAIAGVMGGEETGVTVNTKSVLIEVANFDSITIRRGARKLNIQTDAQQRYEKGLSTAAPPFAMARAIELILELGGGKLTGSIADIGQTKYVSKTFSITTDETNALIGVPHSQKEMVGILRHLGFKIKIAGKKITATVPWWRDHDIEDGRDLVEEIARIEGYANIPAVVPVGLASRPQSPELMWEKRVCFISKGAGLEEIYTYSFVSKDLMAKADYDATSMLHVQNPLTAEFAVMRTSLLPSLLHVASENRERVDKIRLFEIANVYDPPVGKIHAARTDRHTRERAADTRWSDLPNEQLELGALFFGIKDPWRAAKGYVEHVMHELGIDSLSWRRLSSDTFWHPGRTVQVFFKGDLVATVGEVSPKIAENFKLDGPVGLVNVPFGMLVPHMTDARTYIPVPVFPEAKRDLSVVVDHRVEYDDIAREIRRADPLIVSVEWFDTYQGKNLPDGKKSVAVHITMSASDRTLESVEVDSLLEKAILGLKEKLKADLRV